MQPENEPPFTDAIVRRHFMVMHERKLYRDLALAHAVRVGPALKVALDSLAKR